MITIAILAVGLLGIAGLQARLHVLEFESYQRSQAVVIVNELAERISNNRLQAADYIANAAAYLVPGATVDCSDPGVDTQVKKDLCEVGNLLKGAAERKGSTNIGAMDGGRACLTTFTATATKTFNRCQTGVQIEVAWRGRSATITPAATCGAGTYGTNDAVRRVISTRVGTGDVPGGMSGC